MNERLFGGSRMENFYFRETFCRAVKGLKLKVLIFLKFNSLESRCMFLKIFGQRKIFQEKKFNQTGRLGHLYAKDRIWVWKWPKTLKIVLW